MKVKKAIDAIRIELRIHGTDTPLPYAESDMQLAFYDKAQDEAHYSGALLLNEGTTKELGLQSRFLGIQCTTLRGASSEKQIGRPTMDSRDMAIRLYFIYLNKYKGILKKDADAQLSKVFGLADVRQVQKIRNKKDGFGIFDLGVYEENQDQTVSFMLFWINTVYSQQWDDNNLSLVAEYWCWRDMEKNATYVRQGKISMSGCDSEFKENWSKMIAPILAGRQKSI